MIEYIIIAAILLVSELVYFRIADKCNIIDKPNERSSHTKIVLRGGGIIFAISMLVWFGWQTVQTVQGVQVVQEYLPFIVGLVLICGVSFWDDVKSLPDSVRLVVQFVAMTMVLLGLMVHDSWFMGLDLWLKAIVVIISLIVAVGGTNIFNFMDGINGITAAYSLAMLLPLAAVNGSWLMVHDSSRICELENGYIEQSYLIVAIIGVLVFSLFNFRPRGKAKCFAGDVGSIGMALILVFAVGRLMLVTGDVTWIVLFLVYGVDGMMTIFHRIMLHEHLGEAHRKHAYQLMANELKMSHVTVSCIYMVLQLAISLGFIYLCPNTIVAHWIYAVAAGLILAIAYVLFMKKYYYLHEAYLKSLEK